MKMVGQIPIDRDNLSRAINTLDDTASLAISEKKTISIAPEGTRRRSYSTGPEQLMPFKKGPFHLARNINTDIIPVSIVGTNRLFRPGQLVPTPGNLKPLLEFLHTCTLNQNLNILKNQQNLFEQKCFIFLNK